MKAPDFWNHAHPLSVALLPLAALYRIAGALRNALAKRFKLPVPVICIGNLTAGGAGKTPVALAIGEFIKEKGLRGFYVSRGYGGSLSGPVRVDSVMHSAREVGDEPLLLARVLPTIVAKNRVQGALEAITQGAQAIILDDGFQNPSLHKDFSFVVIDGPAGFGNGRLLPAGPLREPVIQGLQRAQAVIVVGDGEIPLPKDLPLLRARILPLTPPVMLQGRKLLAFCGIGRPEKFFATLRELGAELAMAQPFPDHHPYTASDMEKLLADARKHQAVPTTTAKDAVRLPTAYRALVTVIDITLVFDKPELLSGLLEGALHGEKTQA